MHPEEAEEHLAVIRSAMERTTRYTGLPAVACHVAGALGIVGYVLSRWFDLDFRVPRPDYHTDWDLARLWGTICGIAVTQFVAFTIVSSRKRGEPAWSRLSGRVVLAVAPGIVVAAVLTWHFAWHLQFDLLPPIWCLAYGASLWGLGLYAGWKAMLVGALFIVAGTVGLLWVRAHGLELMAVSFGGLHFLLGLLIPVGHAHRLEN